jgi:putative nucleotidyltransferase with HDIG domain
MQHPSGTMDLSYTLPHTGRAVWGTPNRAQIELTRQADPTWIERLPLQTLEPDLLYASLGLPTRTRDTASYQYGSKQHLYSVLSILALAIKAKDPQLYLHSRRVQSLAKRLMQAMNLPKEERITISLAALLHDIGKIYIEDALLQKAGNLTCQEFEVIKEHPAHGALILDNFKVLKHVVPIVYHHHERWDGNGYPDSLSGEAIPLGARIVAIADAFEVMTSDRVYQATRTPAEALEELYLCAGTQFDPYLVECFSTLVGDTSAVGIPRLPTLSMLRPLHFGGITLRPVALPNPTGHSVQTAS